MADIILDLPGIVGEATYEKYKNMIVCQSMSINAAQEVERTKNQTRTIHTVNIEDITLTRLYDKSSWAILDAMITGKTFPVATISVLKAANVAGKGYVEFVTYKLTNALIASCNTSFSDSEVTEEIALNFTKMQVIYFPQKPDGTLDGQVGTNFNLQLGQKEPG